VAKNQFAVDSSVVSKWFLEETDSFKAIELRDSFAVGKVKLAVPTLLYYEVMNALRFSGAFKRDDLVVASRSLSKYRFDIWRPRGKLLELSTELSAEGNLTVYDACYVALAQRLGSKLITEDKGLLSKFPEHATAMSEFAIERS